VSAPPKDPWRSLAAWTSARIALGRAGASLPTREVLAFSRAHAQARDAVHAALDADALCAALRALGQTCVAVESQAVARDLYLRRPDKGRLLDHASARALVDLQAPASDVALVIADGLSATAVHAHALPLVTALLPRLAAMQLSLAPIVVARGARVALGDEVTSRLRAQAVAVLIGERPGLSSPDSLGVYLTFAPQAGRTDAERNCISNVRTEGLGINLAAFKLAWLLREALRRGLSGVALKDESDTLLSPGAAPPELS
jgi:ethanolamine ammonia-lyase small subunit